MKKYRIKIVDKKVNSECPHKYLWNRFTDAPISYYIKSKSFIVYDQSGKVIN